MVAFVDAFVILALAALGAGSASGPALAPAAWLALTTPLLVRSDLRSRRLPNVVTLPGLGILLVALVVTLLQGPKEAVAAIVATLATAVIGFAAALTPGLGMGDAKLGTLVVGSVSLVDVGLALVLLVVASLVAALAVVGRRSARPARVPTTVAFGPCLLLGYWAALGIGCLAL
jgi:leader peptidase (prepilin peptidase) / N-methyltransferase